MMLTAFGCGCVPTPGTSSPRRTAGASCSLSASAARAGQQRSPPRSPSWSRVRVQHGHPSNAWLGFACVRCCTGASVTVSHSANLSAPPMPRVLPRTAVYGTTLTAKSHRSLKHIITTGLEPVEGACVRAQWGAYSPTQPVPPCAASLPHSACSPVPVLHGLAPTHQLASLCVAIVHSLSPHLPLCTAGCPLPTPQA